MSDSSRERIRLWRERRKTELAAMPKVPCACGCGTLITPRDYNGKTVLYVKGHGTKGKPGKVPWNRIGDRPLTMYEKTRRHLAKKRAAAGHVLCACGCGEMIPALTAQGKPARYKVGHQPGGEQTRFVKGQPAWNKGRPAPWAVVAHKGRKASDETRLKIKIANQRRREQGWTPPPRRVTEGTRERLREAARRRAWVGERNPFYGKHHSEQTRCKLRDQRLGKPGHPLSREARARISASLTGPKHHHWKGGASRLPYGPEFTRRFKALIRERDHYRCRRCGMTEAEYGKTFHIHHLDYNKLNNDPANLVTSCPRCNIWHSFHRDRPFLPE